MWQVLLCLIAVTTAAPDWSIEDNDDYYVRPLQYRVVPRVTQYTVPLMKFFPTYNTAKAAPYTSAVRNTIPHRQPVVKAVDQGLQADVTHVQNSHQVSRGPVVHNPAPVYYKYDFDDDDDDFDDDDHVFKRSIVSSYSAKGSNRPGNAGSYVIRYDDEDEDDEDDQVYFFKSEDPDTPMTYSVPTGQVWYRYYDDDLFDFDD